MSVRKQTGGAIAIRGLSKSYGSVLAVDDVTIEVGGGEFVALLGPSGSGKSTILMSIAGFETPSRGDILLDGQRINEQPPHRRGIGMVFQKYALFPHLTVAENIAYPLRRRGLERHAIGSETGRALDMVRLAGFGPRYPAQLSGGEQQRVALARALVFHPPVLLLDEPLGALDRKLRQRMQMEIKLLHREIRTTIIFVTHDQEEALSMADRIAVLHRGTLQQIGTPTALYETPSNAFVADFIGETNFLPIDIVESAGTALIGRLVDVPATLSLPLGDQGASKRLVLAVRPEHISVVEQGRGVPATVVETAYAGSSMSLLLDVGKRRVMARIPAAGAARAWSVGEKVGLLLDRDRCRLFESETSS
jgi:putative spermidine/putrescine transport system ATP-binding protein